jgi:hypothetical protein
MYPSNNLLAQAEHLYLIGFQDAQQKILSLKPVVIRKFSTSVNEHLPMGKVLEISSSSQESWYIFA